VKRTPLESDSLITARGPVLSRFVSGALGAAAMAASLPLASTHAGAGEAAPPPASRVNVLVNFEFADKYVTPRGMIVHDRGLTFQNLVLGLVNVYKGDSFISDVTLVPGIWNDFSTDGLPNSNGDGKTGWIEIDPIAGISVSFARQFKLDVTYTAFNMQVLNIPFSQHLETKLSFDDTPYLKQFALHPYFLYWQEIQNKATAAQVPYAVFLGESGPGPGYYFDVGVAPSYTFENIGLKLEAPCRVLLPDSRFYGEYYDDSSTVGLWEVGVKGSIPLKFMPPGFGHWSFHAGVKYMRFEDENLQGMQEFNAPGKKTDDTWQIFCGLSTFF
jgi:hypothetical protein